MSNTEPESTPERDDSAPPRPRWWLHGLLFVATLVTMSYHGASITDVSEPTGFWPAPLAWGLGALYYAVPLMAILFSHEMGHYLTARRYGVDASPPFFMPGFPPFGTFGAFIKMHLDTVSASHLFRIGAGGPYAGFVVALPVLVVGLLLSELGPVPEGSISLGDSLLVMGLIRAIFGVIPEGQDVFLHPVAYAGWVGMFVTSFNLVPLGQLDGGHIAYTLFGERFNKVAWVLFAALVALGLVFQGWLVLSALLLFLGIKHPPVVKGHETVKGADRVAAWGALALFVLTFTPRPFEISLFDVL